MKTYIFNNYLLGVILGISVLGCTEGDEIRLWKDSRACYGN